VCQTATEADLGGTGAPLVLPTRNPGKPCMFDDAEPPWTPSFPDDDKQLVDVAILDYLHNVRRLSVDNPGDGRRGQYRPRQDKCALLLWGLRWYICMVKNQ
jgi:hypothetical protein